MSDRSVMGFDPDDGRQTLASAEICDRDLTSHDVMMLTLAALAVVFALGLLALGF